MALNQKDTTKMTITSCQRNSLAFFESMNTAEIATNVRNTLSAACTARQHDKIAQYLSSLESIQLGPAAVLGSRIFEVVMQIRTNKGEQTDDAPSFFLSIIPD